MFTVLMAEEERYSNRQIERMLELQSHDLKEHIDKATQPILSQVIKTNGRVNKAEEDIVNYKIWRGWMTGGMAMLMIFVPIIIGFLTFIGLRVINFDNMVQNAINKALVENL